MNAQDLKNSILQRAIKGKLVPQRKEEGTAKELLAEIRAGKARLVKEKKIKKNKPLPEITDEEKPFDIPELGVGEAWRIRGMVLWSNAISATSRILWRGNSLVKNRRFERWIYKRSAGVYYR